MDKNEMLKSLRGAKSKLMAAISMLLVSAILCTNVTYTWFVLSTAPEVSGVSTTSGSNGALEIALQSTNVNGGRVEEIRNGVGDSSALVNTTAAMANVTWGNVVDVTTGYGIEDITLYPARLNLDQNTNSILTSSYLAVPQYGTDGRVHSLKNADVMHYVQTASGGSFEKSINYGVNVHGFAADVGQEQVVTSYFSRETVRQEAAKNVSDLRDELRDQMADLINKNSTGLVSIMMNAGENNGAWTPSEKAAIESLIYGASEVADDAVEALRWALLACAVADNVLYTPGDEAEMLALGTIYGAFRTLPLTATDPEVMTVRSIAAGDGTDEMTYTYPELVQAVDMMVSVQNSLAKARGYLENNNYTFAGASIVSPTGVYVMAGGEVPMSPKGTGGRPGGLEIAMDQAMNNGNENELGMFLMEDELYFIAVSETAGSGIFPDMAYILGDYPAEIVTYLGEGLSQQRPSGEMVMRINYHMKSTVAHTVHGYDEMSNTGALYTAYEAANENEAQGKIPMQIKRSDVTAYGYSVDMAFRASENGNLILQQNALSRVNDGTENPAVQGAGTTMTFQIFGDMTGEQAEDLVENIYVVFMNTDTGAIYGVGVPDKVQADLDTVTATLKLHSLDTDTMNTKKDGILRVGSAKADNVILPMTAGDDYFVTAVVFLNGDTVTSGSLASQGLSLVGSVNLQFTTDTNLVSMRPGSYYTVPEEGGND